MSGTIIRPTTSNLADALAQDGEYGDLLEAMTKAGMRLNVVAISNAVRGLGDTLQRTFPQCDQATALAVVATVSANHLADLVMQIERSLPMGDAARDGRVRAVKTFVSNLLERAVTERALVHATRVEGDRLLSGGRH